MPRKPNDLETLANPRPKPRYTRVGDEDPGLATPGYDLISRRPRTRVFDEIVPAEQADRIEGYFRPMIDRSYDTDY
mgnify:CR=1 FL=1